MLEPLADTACYDFDQAPDRRESDCVKWRRYGPDVLPLWVADLDFPAPRPVVEALLQRVEHGVFGYGVEPPELREVVRAKLEREYGWQVPNEALLFTPGVVTGFNLASLAVAGPGGGVVIQPPIYPPFFAIGPKTGVQVQQAPLALTESGYELDADAFARALTPESRLLLFCNPHNPVGRVFTPAELAGVAEVCLRHDLIICSDEIHQDFIYNGHRHVPIATLSPEVAERTITLIAPSKTYNIAGFHCAIAVVPNPELRQRLEKAARGLMPGRPGVLDFVAATAAYSQGGEWLRQLLAYLEANRDFLVRYVREQLPGVSMFAPEGSYVAWLDCREAGLPGLPGEYFLREARVALGEGADFGAPGVGFVRLNFGCSRATLTAALEQMKAALAAL
ncbi:MAG: MalY/PatB family protein [Chloroflexota bacterium]